jgi:hypothetical protein
MRASLTVCAYPCAPVAPTARATGADWDVLVVMRSSSGVVGIEVEAGWMVSES